jgi:kynurenine formamidase
VRSFLSSLSNWGRWGEDDQRGTLNFLTPEVIKSAIGSVTEGEVISCSLPIWYGRVPDDEVPDADPCSSEPGRPYLQPLHFMLRSGEGVDPQSESRHSTGDVFVIAPHGLGVTHIDAPCHTIYQGTLFNGIPASAVQMDAGALAGSVELVAGGIVGRSVLLDIAALAGRALADGEAVYPSDLDACEEAQGVQVGRGDLLLIRTGYRQRKPRGAATSVGGYPGLQAACLPWLREREIALLATDTAADVRPHGYSLGLPIHTVGMWAMGLWLVDNCDFESLSEACAARDRWDPLLVIAPLVLTAGTGSPVNPLAVF